MFSNLKFGNNFWPLKLDIQFYYVRNLKKLDKIFSTSKTGRKCLVTSKI